MKILLVTLFLSVAVFGGSFSKRTITGVWEISSTKTNGTISFGKDIGKERREIWTLFFNRQGRLKVQETGSIYNYKIVGGKLKIYETKVYRNNYEVKQKNRYDLMQIVGSLEGCSIVKTIKKKITGIKKKDGFKMCKVEEMPQPTYQHDINNYKF